MAGPHLAGQEQPAFIGRHNSSVAANQSRHDETFVEYGSDHTTRLSPSPPSLPRTHSFARAPLSTPPSHQEPPASTQPSQPADRHTRALLTLNFHGNKSILLCIPEDWTLNSPENPVTSLFEELQFRFLVVSVFRQPFACSFDLYRGPRTVC